MDIDVDRSLIRGYAASALDAAGARHWIPTPIDAVMHATQLESIEAITNFVEPQDSQAKLLFRKLSGKLRGFLAAKHHVVWVDPDLRATQSRFVQAHEIGHHVLPWQREAYHADSVMQLRPDTKEQFEREASQFASDLLFNLDDFTRRASDGLLSLATPLELSNEFEASAIASCRRYVEEHEAACALIVFGQYETRSLGRPGVRLLYGVESERFRERYGPVMRGLKLPVAWPWDYHAFAQDAFWAVARRGAPLVGGTFVAPTGDTVRYEVFAGRPHPIALLVPRKFAFPRRVPEVRFAAGHSSTRPRDEEAGIIIR